MRILYYVPIIHTRDDYGSIGIQIAEPMERRIGSEALAAAEKEVQNFWTLVRERVCSAIPDPTGFLIYQDSLPVGPRDKILELFECYLSDASSDTPKSENFRLLNELIEKGGILTGIEDMNLMKAQIDLEQRAARGSSQENQAKILRENNDEAMRIMRERDVFIAQRINETLPENGRGILFIGREHKVIEELDKLEEAGRLLYPVKAMYL